MNLKTKHTAITLTLALLALGLTSACSSSDVESNAQAKIDATAIAESSTATQTIWTCSMDPQIRMQEPGDCPICGMDLIPATSGEDNGGERSIKLSENARKLASLHVSPVERHVLTREIQLVGLVEYDETTQRNINAWFPGRIDKLQVNFTGVTVEKGQAMAEIYSPELISAQEELLQAIESAKKLRNSNIEVVRDGAETTIAATREKLRLWGITTKQIANIENSGEIQDHITIYAPISGVVTTRNASEGDFVKAGTRLFTLADLSTVWLSLDAYESDIDYLRKNQEITFSTNTYPGENFTGKITFIDPTLNLKSRTVRARVEVSNSDGRLKPGMFAHAIAYSDLEAEDNDIPLTIPASAALLTGKRAVVYVQDPNDPSLFSGREVTLGGKSANSYVVKEGLSEGELVVTNGAFKIDAAMQIQAKPSMMYASGDAPKSAHDHGGMDKMKMNDSTSSRSSKKSASNNKMKHVKAPKDVTPAFEGYFDIQEALRSDEADAAIKAAQALATTLATFKTDSLATKDQESFFTLSSDAQKASKALSKSADIAAARTHFLALTTAMIALADSYGIGEVKATYQYHCPMAFAGKGASWFQRAEGLLNPYYGASMLHCGKLERVIGDTSKADSTEHKGH